MPISGETGGAVAPDASFRSDATPAIGSAPLKWLSPRCGSHGSCVEIANLPEGGVAIRDGKAVPGPVLRFTRQEWDAFIAGVKAGEFD